MRKQRKNVTTQATAELGYAAPPPGRRRGYRRPERRRRTGRLALLIPGMPRSVMRTPVYMEVQRGIERAARAAGQALLFSHILPGEPMPAQLVPQQIDGAVVFGDPDDPRLPRELRQVPLVRVMGQVDALAGHDHVTYDNVVIGRLAADCLLGRGHRHCGFVGDDAMGGLYGERGAVFRRCLEAAGGSFCCAWDDRLAVVSDEVHEIDLVRMGALLDRLLARRPRPTGLFLPADMLTNAAYPLLYERGVVPGRDIEIVSCNNEELLLANLHPRPAVVDIQAELVGRRAVEQLLWRLDQPTAGRVKILIEPALLAGPRENDTHGHA